VLADFDYWSRLPFDAPRWADLAERVSERRQAWTSEAWAGVWAAALRTGTLDAARHPDAVPDEFSAGHASWLQTLAAKGVEGVEALHEREVAAHALVLEAADAGAGLSEAFLLRLHAELTSPDEQYAVDYDGRVVLEPLPRGEYKRLPNDSVRHDDRLSVFAPPDVVPEEIALLAAQTERAAFTSAHPVRQAAYVLWAVNSIHPFADGNGRVARASSSLFLFRAIGLPMVLTPERRLDYLTALALAREGEIHLMVDYVFAEMTGVLTHALALAG
jgi:Fic family protein